MKINIQTTTKQKNQEFWCFSRLRLWITAVVILLVVLDTNNSSCDAYITVTPIKKKKALLLQQPTTRTSRGSPMNYGVSSFGITTTSPASRSSVILHSVASASSATNILGSVRETLSAFSSSGAATNVVGIGASTSPLVYFLALLSAGIGLPVSEDILCIFCGTLLDKVSNPTLLIVALFVGVVLSDMLTFSIGRLMKVGLLEPLRKRMKLTDTSTTNDDNQQQPKRTRKRDKILQKLEASGDWAGFVVRLSAGLRPGMMLLSGFSGKVTFLKYALGTIGGCFISLPVQLLLGYSMSHLTSPAAIMARASKIFVIAPLTALGVSTLLLRRNSHHTDDHEQ